MIYFSQEKITDSVCAGKLKEIVMGLDGFMVHDVRLVSAINQVID